MASNQRSKASSASASASSSAATSNSGSIPRLDRPLVQKIAAEGVDRADARELELLQRQIEPPALLRSAVGARLLRFRCADAA